MTEPELNKLLADWARLLAYVRMGEGLELLPHEPRIVRAVPDPCRAAHARWLLGNLSDDGLRSMRELHPEMVVSSSANGHRYSRAVLCKLAGKPV